MHDTNNQMEDTMTIKTQAAPAAKKAPAKAKAPKRIVRDLSDQAALVATLVERFNKAKADRARAEEEKDAAELAIRELLGNAEAGSVDGVERLKLGFGSNSSIDRAKLAEAFPEAFEACSRTTPYTFIKAV